MYIKSFICYKTVSLEQEASCLDCLKCWSYSRGLANDSQVNNSEFNVSTIEEEDSALNTSSSGFTELVAMLSQIADIESDSKSAAPAASSSPKRPGASSLLESNC